MEGRGRGGLVWLERKTGQVRRPCKKRVITHGTGSRRNGRERMEEKEGKSKTQQKNPEERVQEQADER